MLGEWSESRRALFFDVPASQQQIDIVCVDYRELLNSKNKLFLILEKHVPFSSPSCRAREKARAGRRAARSATC